MRLALLFALSLSGSPWATPEIFIQGLFTDKVFLTVNGEARLLKAGETSAEGITVISADSLGAELEINGVRAIYHLDERIRVGADSDPAVLQLVANRQGMFTSPGFINQHAVNFLVDTGATTIAMNLATAETLALAYDTRRPLTVTTAGGEVRAYPITLDQVRVGSITIANVQAVVLEGDNPSAVLLGMSFLSRVQMKNNGTLMELRQVVPQAE
jgi:aspartyl protease family protein